MPFLLPLGLLEISLQSINSRIPFKTGFRPFHSTLSRTTSLVGYPTRLSIDADQHINVPQEERDDLHVQISQPSVPGLSEEDLKEIYRDLLRFEHIDKPRDVLLKSIPDPATVLPRLDKRLSKHAPVQLLTERDLETLSSRLHHRLSSVIAQPQAHHISQGKPYSNILNALQQNGAIPLPAWIGNDPRNPGESISSEEWIALVEACIQQVDIDAAITSLRLMKVIFSPSAELYERVLDCMAQEGLFREIQAFSSEFLSDQGGNHPHFRHLITALCKCRLYTTATQLVHTQEMKRQFPDISVYQALITGLLQSPTPGNGPLRARAWNLFYHMRYVAHSQPTANLYAVMIKSCADSPEPDTTRGFDLWTEMTMDKRIIPTVQAYNAIIKLAARTKATAPDAIRLAQEMLELGRDAEGRPSLPLNEETCASLLEACKRIGDLRQARWLITKLARSGPGETSLVDSWALRHMFHTYAVYKPPFKRKLAATVPTNEKEEKSQITPEEFMNRPDSIEPRPRQHLDDIMLPQTNQSVISEADKLFELLIEEQERTTEPEALVDRPLIFAKGSHPKDVIQAYLSVHFHHSSVMQAGKVARAVHERLDVPWTAETIRLCMFHFAHATVKKLSPELIKYADELWDNWLTILDEEQKTCTGRWIPEGPTTPSERRANPKSSLTAHTIAKIWASYIKLKVRVNDIDGALSLVHLFEERYPPAKAKTSLSPYMPTNSRTRLDGPHALITATQRGLLEDDSIPPTLAFSDVASLHQAISRSRRQTDISYLTYLLHSYAGAVRDRRRMNLVTKYSNMGYLERRVNAQSP
ncbi:hypothetical protein CPB86DRAFT_702080 [Serendipita vermifera]|nr:hypothetical protein CPB86DRAFT_702080 [Serendipita vermifera]